MYIFVKIKTVSSETLFYLTTMHQQNGLVVVTQNGWCIDVVESAGQTTCILEEKNEF